MVLTLLGSSHIMDGASHTFAVESSQEFLWSDRAGSSSTSDLYGLEIMQQSSCMCMCRWSLQSAHSGALSLDLLTDVKQQAWQQG